MKRILLALGLIILIVVSARFFGDEDAWICIEGQWIKHGNPSSPMPEEDCLGSQAVLGNAELDKAIENFLLSQKEFSWKVASGTTNFCVFQNLDPEEDGLSPVYVWTRCSEFSVENGELKERSGASQPAKISYPNELSYYDLNKFTYEIPRSGSLYDGDIKNIFPERIWANLNFDSKSINQRIWAKAEANLLQPAIGGAKDSKGCLIAAGFSWCQAKKECIRPWEEYCTATTPKNVVFDCGGGKTIEATFYPGDDKYVDISYGTTRVSLPRAMSASGARYARADESIVFWNKGETAFIQENGQTTYNNCVLK